MKNVLGLGLFFLAIAFVGFAIAQAPSAKFEGWVVIKHDGPWGELHRYQITERPTFKYQPIGMAHAEIVTPDGIVVVFIQTGYVFEITRKEPPKPKREERPLLQVR